MIARIAMPEWTQDRVDRLKPRKRANGLGLSSSKTPALSEAHPVLPLPFTPPEPGSAPLGLSLIDLGPHHCRYPLTGTEIHGLDHRFCGRPRVDGSSYCETHKSI